MLYVDRVHVVSTNTCMILNRVVAATPNPCLDNNKDDKDLFVFQEPKPEQTQYVKIIKVFKDQVINFLVNYDKDDIPRNGIKNCIEILQADQYVYIVMPRE